LTASPADLSRAVDGLLQGIIKHYE
jgi:hypothetical protein